MGQTQANIAAVVHIHSNRWSFKPVVYSHWLIGALLLHCPTITTVNGLKEHTWVCIWHSECKQNPPDEGITKILKALEVLDRDERPTPAYLYFYSIYFIVYFEAKVFIPVWKWTWCSSQLCKFFTLVKIVHVILLI